MKLLWNSAHEYLHKSYFLDFWNFAYHKIIAYFEIEIRNMVP